MKQSVLIDKFEPIFDDSRTMATLEKGFQGAALRIDSKGVTYWVFDPRSYPATPNDTYTLFETEDELLRYFHSLPPRDAEDELTRLAQSLPSTISDAIRRR